MLRLRSHRGSESRSGFHSLPCCRFATPAVRVKMKDLHTIMLTNVCYSTNLQHKTLCIQRTAGDVGPYRQPIIYTCKQKFIVPYRSAHKFHLQKKLPASIVSLTNVNTSPSAMSIASSSSQISSFPLKILTSPSATASTAAAMAFSSFTALSL